MGNFQNVYFSERASIVERFLACKPTFTSTYVWMQEYFFGGVGPCRRYTAKANCQITSPPGCETSSFLFLCAPLPHTPQFQETPAALKKDIFMWKVGSDLEIMLAHIDSSGHLWAAGADIKEKVRWLYREQCKLTVYLNLGIQLRCRLRWKATVCTLN